MSWSDRLRQAAFNSPSGKRITFQYEDVSRAAEARGTVFESPGVDGAYVQRGGIGPRRMPLVCIFSGPDCDRQAEDFELALFEDGIGKLEHPLYGTVDVVPLGDIQRTDALKTAANQSTVEVTFWRTRGAVYPSGVDDPQSSILDALAGYDGAAAQALASAARVKKATDRANLAATTKKLSTNVFTTLSRAASAVQGVNRDFAALYEQINADIATLVAAPAELAATLGAFIRLPALADTGDVASRMSAYGDLAGSVYDSPAGNPGTAFQSGTALATRHVRIANDFHASDCFAGNALAGAVLSCGGNPIDGTGKPSRRPLFSTKPEAIGAADALLSQWDAYVAWRDEGFAALKDAPDLGAWQVDTGESYQSLQRAVAVTAGFLVKLSFSLAKERRVLLAEATTPFNLAARFYGRADNDTLDKIINTNNLVGEEFFSVPKGRLIKYYPAPTRASA